MRVVVAFLSLGVVVGTLVGLSASSLAQGAIGLLFAFGGGSAIALSEKLSPSKQLFACAAIASLSIGCFIGIYTSVYASEHQLLTPQGTRVTDAAGHTSVEARKVLRSELMEQVIALDQMARTGRITYENAFEQLKDDVANEKSK
jgi:hypothetical protein